MLFTDSYDYGVGDYGNGVRHYEYGQGLASYGLNYEYGLGTHRDYIVLLKRRKCMYIYYSAISTPV